MALVRTRSGGWQDDSQASSIDWGRPENEMEEGRNRALQRDLSGQRLTSAETMGAADLAAKRAMHTTGLESAERIAQIQADAQRDTARLRGGYNKGGPVVDVGYKHSNNPMYAKFASTMDSSLLAKSRGRK